MYIRLNRPEIIIFWFDRLNPLDVKIVVAEIFKCILGNNFTGMGIILVESPSGMIVDEHNIKGNEILIFKDLDNNNVGKNSMMPHWQKTTHKILLNLYYTLIQTTKFVIKPW